MTRILQQVCTWFWGCDWWSGVCSGRQICDTVLGDPMSLCLCDASYLHTSLYPYHSRKHILPWPPPYSPLRFTQAAVGHDHIEKVAAHASVTDTKKGFGGKFGVQTDRVDKVCQHRLYNQFTVLQPSLATWSLCHFASGKKPGLAIIVIVIS